MKKMFQDYRWLRYALPPATAVIMAAGGYLYYRYVGCASGTCAITSNPVNSAIYGGVMGLLLGVALTPGKNGTRRREEEHHE